MPTSKNML